MTIRDPDPDEKFWVITMRDGTNWMGKSFPSRRAAIEEAGEIGYGGPWYITEVVAVID